jgi:UDP-GlcNAc3NAcA epimerase
MKILTVVGARPQFIKAAAVSRAILERGGSAVSESLVHTGQHYDENMSDVFFEELGISAPVYNLGIGGGTQGAMTGRMLESLEQVFLKERPDWVLIYGDTNSTLAAALAATKLHIPIAHVEAGLRSFNMRMPEEVNRIVADRVSSLLFCPTQTSVENLRNEGISAGVHLVGDVMYDVALHFGDLAASRTDVLTRLGIQSKSYVLATCHRAENTDDAARLAGIIAALAAVTSRRKVILPAHPRTLAKIREFGLFERLGGVSLIEPVSYLEMVMLEKHAAVIVTDSGGVQKEAFFYRVPCVTVRDETEWVETVRAGWNTLVGADPEKIIASIMSDSQGTRRDLSPYGSGDAAERILDVLLSTPE